MKTKQTKINGKMMTLTIFAALYSAYEKLG